MSYRIIKNNTDQGERLLQAMDASAFMPQETILDAAGEGEEKDPVLLMEDRIRKALEEETEKERLGILQKAKAEMAQLKERAIREGEEAGYREGLRKGYEEGRRETEAMRSEALERIESARKQVKAYLEENEENIVRLSVKIAEKIVHQTLDIHADGVMLLARPVLQEYGKTEHVILSCHPENLASIKERQQEIEKYCPNAHLLILEDKSLERNGLVIENENQITDLQVRKQLERFLILAAR